MTVHFLTRASLVIVTLPIFVHCQRLIARKVAELSTLIMAFDRSTQLVASMSWVEGQFRAFWRLASKQRFRNATTQFFEPKLMTMASVGAIRGKYSPNGMPKKTELWAKDKPQLSNNHVITKCNSKHIGCDAEYHVLTESMCKWEDEYHHQIDSLCRNKIETKVFVIRTITKSYDCIGCVLIVLRVYGIHTCPRR